MSCLLGLMGEAAKGVEAQLKPQLSGFFGGVVRSYLPQRWVFVTEAESVTLGVETTGAVWVRAGREPSADVTIETSHDRLAAALRTRSKEAVPAGGGEVAGPPTRGRTPGGVTPRRRGRGRPRASPARTPATPRAG